jgi:hypothetical protein
MKSTACELSSNQLNQLQNPQTWPLTLLDGFVCAAMAAGCVASQAGVREHDGSRFPARHRENQAALSRSTEHGRHVAEVHPTLGRWKN